MVWLKLVTRAYYLLQLYYTQVAYLNIPGFAFKNALVVSNEGVIEKYADEEEVERFYKFLRDHKSLKQKFKKAIELDKELKEIIKKGPIKNFSIFHKKYIEYWTYNLLAYYSGHALNEEQIKPFEKEVEFIRGEKPIINKVELEFFPKLLKELEKKTKIPSLLLSYSLPEEIIENKFDISILIKRRKHYVWLIRDGKSNLYLGKSAEKIEKRELKQIEEDYSKINKVKGTMASSGYVKGKVKVLLKPEEIAKVERGDILITSMTNPKYGPAIEKAAAIITDEGGILCHASIVSREMNKPCIIGTKIATKLLKDGDLVEVDADKGLVRKIKRHKSKL